MERIVANRSIYIIACILLSVFLLVNLVQVIQPSVSVKANDATTTYIWKIETVGTDCVAQETPQIALDRNGRPHVAYHTYASSPSGNLVKYAFRDNSGWHTETITPGAKLQDIAINGNGDVYVSFGSDSKIL